MFREIKAGLADSSAAATAIRRRRRGRNGQRKRYFRSGSFSSSSRSSFSWAGSNETWLRCFADAALDSAAIANLNKLRTDPVPDFVSLQADSFEEAARQMLHSALKQASRAAATISSRQTDLEGGKMELVPALKFDIMLEAASAKLPKEGALAACGLMVPCAQMRSRWPDSKVRFCCHTQDLTVLLYPGVLQSNLIPDATF